MKEFEGKKLLLLGGLPLVCDIVRHAQRMGIYVIVADYLEDEMAKKIADEAVLIDATDVDAIVDYCRKNNVDGVTTGFSDLLMPYCYEVCKRLGLPYYATEKMIKMSTNKKDFKETCMQYDIPVPKTYLIGSSVPEELYDAIEYPVFVKPLDSSGSRGAGVCYNKDELDKQFAIASDDSKTKTAIIEEYLTGVEFLLDYIAEDGEFRLLEMFDRYVSKDRDSAVNYANISIAPSDWNRLYLSKINDSVIKMFKDLGFKDGLIFLQGHSNGEKITFYEMGCRLGGAFYNIEQRILGYNAIDMVIRYALSGKMVGNINKIPTDVSLFNKVGASLNYLLKCNGQTIGEIRGIDKIKAEECVVEYIQHRDVGFKVIKDNTTDKPLVTIHYVCDNINELKDKVNYFNDIIEAYDTSGDPILYAKITPNEF